MKGGCDPDGIAWGGGFISHHRARTILAGPAGVEKETPRKTNTLMGKKRSDVHKS